MGLYLNIYSKKRTMSDQGLILQRLSMENSKVKEKVLDTMMTLHSDAIQTTLFLLFFLSRQNGIETN